MRRCPHAKPPRPTRARRGDIAVLLHLSVLIAAAMGGCREKAPPAPETITSDALVERYGDALLAGLRDGDVHIRAQRRDPQTGELLNLQMQTASGLLTARRARFIVSAYDDTFALELIDVQVAGSAATPSRLVHLESLRTEPIDAEVDVRETLLSLPEDELLSSAPTD